MDASSHFRYSEVMNDPIRHHYSPQFYLRQWAGVDGRLFRYHRPYDHTVVSKRSPEHTGFEDYLYTVEHGDDPQIIEKGFFSNVDNYSAPILEALSQLGPGLVTLGSGHLGNDQRSDWTRFINSLQLRGPHSLAEIGAVLQRSVRENIEWKHTVRPIGPPSGLAIQTRFTNTRNEMRRVGSRMHTSFFSPR